MGLRHPYGVWVCKPLRLDLDDDDKPHIHLYYTDDSNPARPYRVAINVRSSSAGESRLAYWSSPEFKHKILERVPKDLGFHRISGSDQGPNGYALDYIHGNLFDLEKGQLLEYTPKPDDMDLVDRIWAILKKAIKDEAKVYLWGEQFDDETGIHQIHMNQGNYGRFARENGPWQDGGLMVQDKDGWHAIFLAFGVQAIKTDDKGKPVDGAVDFGTLLGGTDAGTDPITKPTDPIPLPPAKLEIISAVVNPVGADGIDNPEIVTVQNPPTASDTIVLRGWSITNKTNDRSYLPDGVVLGPGASFSFALDPKCPLSNKGGIIALWNNSHNVDRVQYSKQDASQQGRVIQFEY